MWHDLNLVVLFYLDFHSIKKKIFILLTLFFSLSNQINLYLYSTFHTLKMQRQVLNKE